jgi:hypothetical protein
MTMGEPQEPVDLPNPVCLAHGINDPCPQCATNEKSERLFWIVPLIAIVLGALALLYSSTCGHGR